MAPPDAALIGQALASICGRPETREAMGNAARALVHSRFTWERVAQQTIEAYAVAGAGNGAGMMGWERPLRVLHVASKLDPKRGGPIIALFGLAEAQARAGLQTAIASTFEGSDELYMVDRLRREKVTVQVLGPVAGGFGWHRKTRPFIQRMVEQADVVHIHALWEDILYHAARTARKLGIPYIVRPCGMLEPWSLRQKSWKKRIYLWLRLRGVLDGAAAINYTGIREKIEAGPLELKPPALVEPIGVDLREFAQLPAPGRFGRCTRRWAIGPWLFF